MFEDLIHDGRDLKEEIREWLTGQLKKAIVQSHERENEKWIVDLCEEEMTKQLDNVVQMYTDFFTSDEIAAILDWNKSELGIRSVKFNDEKMTPFILNFFNTVMARVMERAMFEIEEPVGEA